MNILIESLKKESVIEYYISKMVELITQLENMAIDNESVNIIELRVNEMFKIFHDAKNSSTMMNFESIASLLRSIEDAFCYIKENYPVNVDYTALKGIILKSADFIKNKLGQIQEGSDFNTGDNTDRDVSAIVQEINEFLSLLRNGNDLIYRETKNTSLADENIGMENIKPEAKHSMINISMTKLDKLMDLVDELFISQAMLIQNPELEGLNLSSFNKASNQLSKLTNDLHETVMSMRMVPLSETFRKIQRVVQDMGKKLNKELNLEIIGEETEVDMNIIEHLSDLLIHLVRNSADYGIESPEERESKGKPVAGKITLEVRNEGWDVWITVKDDGRGLNKKRILEKAKQKGLVKKPENELTDREIYSYIFLPEFFTNEKTTRFSAREAETYVINKNMDIINKNIEKIGGTIQIDSAYGIGTSISVKIPQHHAIIDGMKVRVGKSVYIIPITSIIESLKVQESAIIKDNAKNDELIMLRGNCYPVIRLHEFFNLKPDSTNLNEGIIVVVENDGKPACMFADELMGVQQVVVKALPKYIKRINSISGCTVIENGNVSLIIDVSGLINSSKISL